MPIDFRLHNLQVRNFRGLRSLDLEFPEDAPMVLIGANNACKSTILDAISLALNGPSFYNFTQEKYDFFHDAAGNIADALEVTISFAAPTEIQLPAVRGGVGNPISVHGVRVSGSVDRHVSKASAYFAQTELDRPFNGISCARSHTSGLPYCGVRREQTALSEGRPGDARSPTARNLRHQRTVRIFGSERSN